MLIICLPDFDVLAFKPGIAYSDTLGYRGFSHSLLFAGMSGFLAALSGRLFGCSPLTSALWISLATASHSLLDTLTNGGPGGTWLWPWSAQRLFMPWRPIAVSPFIDGFLVPAACRCCCPRLAGWGLRYALVRRP